MVEEKSLVIDTNQTVNLYVASKIDDSNLRDPHGRKCGERFGYFNKKIIVENIGQEILKGINLTINDKNYSTFRDLKKYLKLDNSQSDSIKKIYSFWKDNVVHATSDKKINDNPYYLLNFWGYGLCGNSAEALTVLLSYMDIPARRIHLNGHRVSEYFYENKWNIIDGDQNVVYIKLDNKTLASFREVLEDPFIAQRTNVLGKYTSYNIENSCANTALFEFINPKENPIQKIDKRKLDLEDSSRSQWVLFPGEKIIFHYDESPEMAIGESDISAWENVKDITLGKIQVIIDTALRRETAKSDTITISTKYPVYKIVDHISGRSMYLPKEQVCTQLNLCCDNNIKQVSVFCHGARESFPIISKGENVISLKGQGGSGKAKITFNYNMFEEDMCLPQIRAVNLYGIFKYKQPLFDLEGSGDIEKIWWQICDQRDFQFIIPNFDCLQDFSKRVELSKIDNSFFRNNGDYYFRVKARSKGIWGEWSSPFQFSVIKPNQPENVKYLTLEETKIKITWDCEDADGLEYLIFGSSRLDFIPDIYADKQINKMIDGIAKNTSKNENLLMTTSEKYCVLDDKNLFYRIIARRDSSFSTPSSILSVHSKIGNTERGIGFPKVLQVRHSIRRGKEYENGSKNIYEAKEMRLPTPEEDSIGAIMKRGEELYKKREYNKAFSEFTKVIKKDPDNCVAYNGIGIINWELGNVEKSLEGFSKALELNPLDQSTILNIVDVLKAIRKVDDAKDICSSYLKAKPDDVEVREAYATL
jgi:hypothetical protein